MMDGGDPNQLSEFPGGSQPFSAWSSSNTRQPFYQLQNSFSTGNLFNQGFGLRGPLLHASQAHLGPLSPYQSILFAPLQNYPDLIAGEITADEFSDALSTIEPDVIPNEPQEPTYQNEGDSQQATYMNENNTSDAQPMYANDEEDTSPAYINEETVEEIKKELTKNVNHRSNFLPLQKSASTFVRSSYPVAPPRSRRSSARSSLASSTVSLNIFGSCASLKECHPVHIGKDPPSRPVRRRDRLRRTAKHLTSSSRNNVELTQIPENEATYDVPQDSPKSVSPGPPPELSDYHIQNTKVSHVIPVSKTSISNLESYSEEKSILADDIHHSEVSITLLRPPLPLNIPLINSEELVEPIIDSIIRKPLNDNFKIQDEDSDNFLDAEYSSDSSDKNELSISETGEGLLKDIRNMDDTIKNMAREVTKMIKVYDVVSFKGSLTNQNVVMDEPVKIEVIDNSGNDDDYDEGDAHEQLVDGRTRDQINKDFRAAFFGIDDDSGNDYDFFVDEEENRNIQGEGQGDDNKEYDDIVELSTDITTDTDDDDMTEIIDIKEREASFKKERQSQNSDKDEDTLYQEGSMCSNATTLSDDEEIEDREKLRDERYDELVYKSMKFNWDDIQGENPNGLPPPLLLQEQIRNLKLDLLSSIFQRIYPLEEDLVSINNFISCPASLEEKYSMMRLADILKKNKKFEIELESLAEAMSQLAQIGQELLKQEEDRDPSWRSIPVAKEITVVKGIASRAPWEQIKGGTEILESLGYTEYTGFSLQYPRSVIPDLFADHIGNLTVELVLASVEISTLVVRSSPTMDTLVLLQEAVAFPGNESEDYDPDTEPGEQEHKLITRPYSALVTMNHMNTNEEKEDDDFSVRSLPNLSPDHYYASFPNQSSHPVPHQSQQRRSMIFMEGDYEEIGPGSPVMRSNSRSNGKISNQHLSRPLCDLCGRNPALIRCQYCSGQIFCMSCDDMYHKHPKRANHSRKALPTSPMTPLGAPSLPPKSKGMSPIAPPRRNSRKSSLPDASRLIRSSTLPRKGSIPIAGRPLPPPPPLEQSQGREYNNTAPPPLPPSLMRTQSLQRNVGPPPITAAKPVSMKKPVSTITVQSRMDPPPLGPRSSIPSFNPQAPYPYSMDLQGQQQTQQIMTSYPTQNGGQSHNELWNPSTQSHHHQQQYLDDMQFSSIPNAPTSVLSHQGSNPTQRRRRFNNQRLNKSSSFHNIAHAEMSDQGITWEDQWISQQQNKSPNFLPPFHQNNFKRALSSKSLHDSAGTHHPWDSINNGAFLPHPLFNPMGRPPSYNHSGPPNNIHRSMHELHNLGNGFNPFHYDPRVRRSSPVPSASESHKSKKNSSDRRSNKGGSRRRRHSSSGRHSSTSSHRRRGRSQSRRHSSSEESYSSEESSSSEEDCTEDFFTGESDNDFVSISSGSNPKSGGGGRSSKKTWVCEHCTYVNAPGGNVCTMCCRTSKATSYRPNEEEMNERGGSSSKKKSGGSKRNSRNFDAKSDDENERRSTRKKEGPSVNIGSKKRSDSKKNSSKSKSNGNISNISDLEDDAIQAYYALRRKGGGKMDSEGDGTYESNSSDAASAHNPHKTPNFDAPAPTKGILKKSCSNPQLSKIINEDDFDDRRSVMTTKTDIGHLSAKLNQQLGHFGPSKVVDINKYLAQTQTNPNIQQSDQDFPGSSEDIWQAERNAWIQSQQRQHQDYMSDVTSTATTNISRLYRPTSNGVRDNQSMYQEHANEKSMGHDPLNDENASVITSTTSTNHNNINNRMTSRRVSDVSSGRRNFRSKRFSRDSHRDPSLPRGRSFGTGDGEEEGEQNEDSWDKKGVHHSDGIKKVESKEDDGLHFTATIEEQEGSGPPGGIGSYLSRREFGSNDASGMPDSGYVSHSSGGGSYTKLQLPTQAPIESFTMSVDRGFLGKNPTDREMFISMDDLSSQKAKGLELVRLLREAEQAGYTAEDIQLALNHCGESNPIIWLKENWDNMNETVVTLASNVGFEAKENTIGTISRTEATDALRKHKGNVWAAVTECVELRQAKYDELSGKGNFQREDIVTMLTAHHGNVEASYQELNKEQLKPFLMRIWGQGEVGEVKSGNVPSLNLEEEVAENDVKAEFHVQLKASETVEKDPKVLEFERRARKLLAQEKVPSYEKAEIALHLVEEFESEDLSLEDAIEAALPGNDLESARLNLKKECELCAHSVTLKEIVKLPSDCEHQCCKDCTKNYFTLIIKDKNINEASCPFCKEPSQILVDEEKEEEASNYFAKLDNILQSIVDKDIHDLFQRKLRDRVLMKDPNFKWCNKCSSGFIAAPHTKKLSCPDCKAESCAQCHVPWEPQHENTTCDAFAAWKRDNDPESQEKGLEDHLKEYGITCPACKFRYTLTKGGCMHFVCTQCKFEFCIGCKRPFKMGVKCGKGPVCARMGLHAHHPRNCLFYLRDKEPKDLIRLLRENKVEYKSDPPPGISLSDGCRIPMQREKEDGMMEDGLCSLEAPEGFAGYCKTHYTEYLCAVIFEQNIEPVSVFELGELKQIFNRTSHFMPSQRTGEYEFQYKKRLKEMIKHEIPLEAV